MSCKKEGSITVFLSISLLLIISILLVTIESAIYSGAKLRVVSAVDLGMKSLQADYSTDIYDEFGLMLLKQDNTGTMLEILWEYISYNIDVTKNIHAVNTDLYGINMQSIKIKEIMTPRDDYGLPFESMVCSYMEVAAPMGIGENIINKFVDSDKNDAINKAVQSIDVLSQQTVLIDKKVYEFIKYADGVVIDNGNISIEANYAKQFCQKPLNIYSTSVNDLNILNKLKPHYYNQRTGVLEMRRYLNDINSLMDEGQNYSSESTCFLQVVNELERYVNNVYTCLQNAKTTIDEIESRNQKLKTGVDSSKKVIDGLKIILGDELHSEMIREVEQYSNYVDSEKIIDIESSRTSIYKDIEVLDNVKSILATMKTAVTDENIDTYYSTVNHLLEVFAEYDIEGIKVDYSRLNLNKQTDSSVLDTISNTLKEGFLGLVIGDINAISRKKISNNEWLKDYHNINVDDYIQNPNPANRFTKNVLVNEYAMKKFTKYQSFGNHLLDYEIEYIIAGKASDKENLSDTLNKIVLIRQGMNFMYLLTDSQKKAEAYTLAVTLVGASGVPVLITATKWAILGLWAYAEAIIDVRNLLNEKSVPLIKNRNNFNLTLENLLSMNLDSNSGNVAGGVIYSDYLRFLLYTGNRCEKYNRMMNLIEMRKEADGVEFRMDKCIYGLAIEVKTGIRDNKYTYIEKTAFCY